jgi:hypothetical protein
MIVYGASASLLVVDRLSENYYLINTPPALGAVAALEAATVLIAASTWLLVAQSSPARMLKPLH